MITSSATQSMKQASRNTNRIYENDGVWIHSAQPVSVHDVYVKQIVLPNGYDNGSMIFVKQGSSSPIVGIIGNSGSSMESNLTCYATILSYVEDPNGILVYQENISGIGLSPGEELNLTFPSYQFADEGLYGLTLSLPLGDDEEPGNNNMTVMIGSDGTPPLCIIAVDPPTPNGNNGWYDTNITITLSGISGCGIKEIWYRIDGGEWILYTGPFILTEGNHSFECYAVDNVGNYETTKPWTFHIDTTPSAIQLWKTVRLTSVTYTAIVQDEISGMDRVEFWIGPYLQNTETITEPYGTQTAVWTLSPIPNINITVTAIAYDLAGNSASLWIDFLAQDLPSGQSQPATPQQYEFVMR